uniref:Peptidase A1 domain-containing protein n=1 Tax=Oryza brachyantha TaxID=4533 RepID=J3MAE6_ORYBR
MPPPGPVVPLLLLLVAAGIAGVASGEEKEVQEEESFHLPITPPVVPESADERREHFRALQDKDQMRHRRVLRQVPALMSNTSTFELPMRSALNIAKVGVYLVVVRIGTPALPYSLALDTANEVTWINCRLRRRRGKHPGRPHVPPAATTMSLDEGGNGRPPVKVIKNWYRPALSSSWRRFRCSQEACANLPYNTCRGSNQNTSCTYFQRVQDGTISSGIYGQEKATVAVSDGTMAKLPGLVLGCSTFEKGDAVDSHDGILSLGNSDASFGVTAARRFAARFSFCLLATASGRNASSYLTFGRNPAVHGPGTMETPMVYSAVNVAYGFRVTAVLVGGQPLDVPPEVWDDRQGGVILDTGTSITCLVPAWSFAGDGVDPAHNVTIPSFAIVTESGARLEPDAKSIVIPEVLPGVACLGFRRIDQGPMIIGNVLMQEHIWEIDHLAGTVRFRKDSCLNHHQLNKNASSSPAAHRAT